MAVLLISEMLKCGKTGCNPYLIFILLECMILTEALKYLSYVKEVSSVLHFLIVFENEG